MGKRIENVADDSIIRSSMNAVVAIYELERPGGIISLSANIGNK